MLTRGRTNFLGWLPGRVRSSGHRVIVTLQGDAPPRLQKTLHLPSDRALTAFCLGLTRLPSFLHILLGLINKARAHVLVWANQERAVCGKEGGVSSRGWQRQTPSSWAVWTGTQRHTGLAAGVPDGSLESPYLQCWLLFMLFTTLSKPTSLPWHPQACTAGWMEALVKAFLFLKGRQRRRQRRGLIFSPRNFFR